nr:MAG: ABC transporter permease [Bacillota bacterium]
MALQLRPAWLGRLAEARRGLGGRAAGERLARWVREVQGWLPAGLGPIARKEFMDLITSWRMGILAALLTVTGIASLYVTGMAIRSAAGVLEDEGYIFLKIFTASDGRLPPFTAFVGFLAPLLGLALGFDAISGEQNRRTLSRLLAQPIHRDAVLVGKFVAGVGAVGAMLLALGMAVGGLGLILIGVPPTGDELLRLLAFVLTTVLYVAFWLALAILLSVVFRHSATSALAGIGIWLFFAAFWDLLADLVVGTLIPDTGSLRHAQVRTWVGRLSPVTLYTEAVVTLLTPTVRVLGPILLEQAIGALKGTLPIGQSLLLITPHLIGLLAGTVVCFAASYVLFMRREIRA